MSGARPTPLREEGTKRALHGDRQNVRNGGFPAVGVQQARLSDSSPTPLPKQNHGRTTTGGTSGHTPKDKWLVAAWTCGSKAAAAIHGCPEAATPFLVLVRIRSGKNERRARQSSFRRTGIRLKTPS